MSPELTFSETPGRPFRSGSAFMDDKPNAKDADAEGIRLIRMDSGVSHNTCSGQNVLLALWERAFPT